MTALRPKKSDTVQAPKSGTVLRLQQQFLEASKPKPEVSKDSQSPKRKSTLSIPKPFKIGLSSPFGLLAGNGGGNSSPSSSTTSSAFSSANTSPASLYPPKNHARQQSAPSLLLHHQPSEPDISLVTAANNSPRITPAVQVSVEPTTGGTSWAASRRTQLQSCTDANSTTSSTMGKTIHQTNGHTKSTLSAATTLFPESRVAPGGLSISSVTSDDSFVSALSHIDSPRTEHCFVTSTPVWKMILDAIEQEDRVELDRVLHAFDFSMVLQTLLTWNYANTDNLYRHDPDVILDAKELLGPTVDHLNLIQIACFLFNEELALDILNYVATASDVIESKKILFEFMGKLWGDGNTTLHLASFLGMADVTKKLLDLGANVYKMNDRRYKPVDCADENTTRSLFLNLTEVVRYRRIGGDMTPTSPASETEAEYNWSSFRALGHSRSTSVSNISQLTSGQDQNLKGSALLGNPSAMSSTPDLLLLAKSNPALNSSADIVASIEELSLADSHKAGEGQVPALAANKLAAGTGVPSFNNGALTNSTNSGKQRSGDNQPGMPRLRTYKSSPSIRVVIKDMEATSAPLAIPATKKRYKKVSFDPLTLMADAARNGDLTHFKTLLEVIQAEAKMTVLETINYQSPSRGLTVLHLASSYNHLPFCQHLISLGASTNLADVEGWTPLHCAAAEGHLSVLEFLVKAPNVDLQAVTYDGELIEDVVEDDDLRQQVLDMLESAA